MDLFATRSASPMLIGRQEEAFDNPEWIYELKMDGFRCLAYMDNTGVDFRNKRNMQMTSRFPELSEIYRNVSGKCILDGEIVVLKKGVPDFYALQKRTLLTDRFKIELEAARFPASFVAFDCIYADGRASEAVSALTATGQNPFQLLPTGNQDAVWVMPDHVCTVEYMPNTRQALRQPVFKGYRQDICPDEVKIYK